MRKNYLGFLVLTLVLVASMFSNAFASSYGNWTCIQSTFNGLPVGRTVNYISDISIQNGESTDSCKFVSSFDVEVGDNITLDYKVYFVGDEDKFDGSASSCWVNVIAENGETVLSISTELTGNRYYYNESKEAIITDETAGKLTVYFGMEDSGYEGVYSNLSKLHLYINGTRV